MNKEKPSSIQVAENRKARFEYEILETFEAGIVLTGSEVKSLRLGRANISDAHAGEMGGAIWLFNAHIAEYAQAGKYGHTPTQPRKLLLNAKEIKRLIGVTKEKGLTLVPLSLYFNSRGFAKIKLAIGKGKKLHDKRESIKDRDWKREQGRLLRKGK